MCVGHNTVDKYVDHGMMYPGGNEVNVSALASRQGIDTSYVGWLGDDVYGHLIASALQEEGESMERCQIKDGVNTYTEIHHEEGDRKFGDIRRGIGTKRELVEKDISYILSHRLLHTGYYSRMEGFMREHSDAIMISYDFSEYADLDFIREHIGLTDIAFITDQVDVDDPEPLLRELFELGPQAVIAMLGDNGSILYDGELYRQPAQEMDQVVDTLGAGDSFIARFLVEFLRDTPLREAMELATQSAAKTCTYWGAFDHGTAIPAE